MLEHKYFYSWTDGTKLCPDVTSQVEYLRNAAQKKQRQGWYPKFSNERIFSNKEESVVLPYQVIWY